MNPFPTSGLYAVTPEHLYGSELSDAVEAAVRGGAKAVQYRNKSGSQDQRHNDAQALVRLCHRYGVSLLINDDVELAYQVNADGVHLGKDDISLADARTRLGPHPSIGISCYDDIGRAYAAHAAGASYIAFGSFFASQVKPDAVRASLELIPAAKAATGIPIVAIGGITPANAPMLLTAGVDVLAVITAVFGEQDPTSGARAFATLFDSATGQEV